MALTAANWPTQNINDHFNSSARISANCLAISARKAPISSASPCESFPSHLEHIISAASTCVVEVNLKVGHCFVANLSLSARTAGIAETPF
jgi:hypothetical protein